jgi:hypothetical protein
MISPSAAHPPNQLLDMPNQCLNKIPRLRSKLSGSCLGPGKTLFCQTNQLFCRLTPAKPEVFLITMPSSTALETIL